MGSEKNRFQMPLASRFAPPRFFVERFFEESKNAVVDAYIAAVKSLSSGSEDGLGKS